MSGRRVHARKGTNDLNVLTPGISQTKASRGGYI